MYSFYVTGPGIRTLVSMACLYIVSIKLASAGGGSGGFGVSVSPQCCLQAPQSTSASQTVKYLVNACETHKQLVIPPGMLRLALVHWPFPTVGAPLQKSVQVQWVLWGAGAQSWPLEDRMVVSTLYTTKENLGVFPSCTCL